MVSTARTQNNANRSERLGEDATAQRLAVRSRGNCALPTLLTPSPPRACPNPPTPTLLSAVLPTVLPGELPTVLRAMTVLPTVLPGTWWMPCERSTPTRAVRSSDLRSSAASASSPLARRTVRHCVVVKCLTSIGVASSTSWAASTRMSCVREVWKGSIGADWLPWQQATPTCFHLAGLQITH
eukprot:scaffold27814_cov77-Phaeocystis_antarctica.AAC.6